LTIREIHFIDWQLELLPCHYYNTLDFNRKRQIPHPAALLANSKFENDAPDPQLGSKEGKNQHKEACPEAAPRPRPQLSEQASYPFGNNCSLQLFDMEANSLGPTASSVRILPAYFLNNKKTPPNCDVKSNFIILIHLLYHKFTKKSSLSSLSAKCYKGYEVINYEIQKLDRIGQRIRKSLPFRSQ
jgi:hypothetical protein